MGTRLKFLYRAYRYRYRVDRAELRFVCDHLRPGQIAVDAGCHKGAYTFWMRRCVGASGAVIAFEPQPQQVKYLEQAFAAMRYRNVRLVPMALSNATGRLPLKIPIGAGYSTHGASLVEKDSPGASWKTVDVDVTTLDAILNDPSRGASFSERGASEPRRDAATKGPDFIKIDVEGHELEVLKGARQTLERHRPTLLIECETRHRPDGDLRPVFDFMLSLGYEGSYFQNGRRHPLAEFNAPAHQPRFARSEKPPVGYVNNFAFEYAP